ncbi:MAG: hypothetical protein JWR50_606 [Mucilaginibacter sp.]|nr:hypothetical protein [Mucilaginibacter sp.]
MAAIDFLKDWELKKHGWPALLVAVLWLGYETFIPKDPSCTKSNLYLQQVNAQQVKVIAKKDSILDDLTQRLLIANHINKLTDSTYRKKVVNPAKEILKKYHHEH